MNSYKLLISCPDGIRIKLFSAIDLDSAESTVKELTHSNIHILIEEVIYTTDDKLPEPWRKVLYFDESQPEFGWSTTFHSGESWECESPEKGMKVTHWKYQPDRPIKR